MYGCNWSDWGYRTYWGYWIDWIYRGYGSHWNIWTCIVYINYIK
jgi:hypothetical protein